MPLYTGFIQLGAGLSVGLAGLAAGFAIGIVGDAGVRGTAQQPRLFVGMVRLHWRNRLYVTDKRHWQILILIFAEVLGLYGLIVALILNTNSSVDYTVSSLQYTICRTAHTEHVVLHRQLSNVQLPSSTHHPVPFPI